MAKLTKESYHPVLDEMLTYYLSHNIDLYNLDAFRFHTRRFIEESNSRLGQILELADINITIGAINFDTGTSYDSQMIFVLSFERFMKTIVKVVKDIMGLNFNGRVAQRERQ